MLGDYTYTYRNAFTVKESTKDLFRILNHQVTDYWGIGYFDGTNMMVSPLISLLNTPFNREIRQSPP